MDNNAEVKLQCECYVFFHNAYPSLRGLLCYNLNNSKNKIDGNLNKMMGLQKGRSDLEFHYKGKLTFIELKTEKGTQSPDQIKWQKLVESHGFEYYVIRNLQDFQQLIEKLIENGDLLSKTVHDLALENILLKERLTSSPNN